MTTLDNLAEAQRRFFDSIGDWEQADLDHHKMRIKVATGTSTPETLAVAYERMQTAEARAIANRQAAGRLLTDLFRFCLEVQELRLNLSYQLRDLFGVDPTEFHTRLQNLEAVVAAGVGK